MLLPAVATANKAITALANLNSSPSEKLETGASVKAAIASAGPGADIDLKYSTDGAGRLVVTGAEITTETKKPVQAVANSAQAAPPKPNVGLSSADFAQIFGLNNNEAQVVNRLQADDAGVRVHEAQHFRAAGGLASGTAKYEYVQGPDGNLYAVAGQVDVSTTPTSDPDKQRRDAQGLYNAASAPADSSAQDVSVARQALQNAANAYQQTSRNPDDRSLLGGNGLIT